MNETVDNVERQIIVVCSHKAGILPIGGIETANLIKTGGERTLLLTNNVHNPEAVYSIESFPGLLTRTRNHCKCMMNQLPFFMKMILMTVQVGSEQIRTHLKNVSLKNNDKDCRNDRKKSALQILLFIRNEKRYMSWERIFGFLCVTGNAAFSKNHYKMLSRALRLVSSRIRLITFKTKGGKQTRYMLYVCYPVSKMYEAGSKTFKNQ